MVKTIAEHGPAGQKLVYISSQTAAGPCAQTPGIDEATPNSLPVSNYGWSKKKAEQIVLSISDRFPVVILRPSIVYGPGNREMEPLFKTIKWGLMVKSGFRKFPVSLIHVDDLVKTIILISESNTARGQTYFVSDGQTYNWDALNKTISTHVNQRALPLPIPLIFIWMTCQLNGIVARLTKRAQYLNPDKWHEIKQAGWLCNSSRLNKEIDFDEHRSLAEGIQATIQWYRDKGQL